MKKITLYITLFLCSLVMAQNHSLNFDGTDDIINLEQNFAFETADAFTVEAWINHDNQGNIQQIIAKLGAGVLSFRGWGFQMLSNGRLSGYVSTEFFMDYRFVRGTEVLAPNTWYHVAMTYDGQGNILLYLNGAPEPISSSEDDGELTTITTSAPTRIGGFGTDGNIQELFKGDIDEVRIWNGVRTPEEIAANYMTELSGSETNLIGYYKMDVNNSSCDVQDCNANEAHGERLGENGANNLPQFSDNVPGITDVACGETLDCTLSVDEVTQLELSMFPNPTTDLVSFSGINLNGAKVKLYNVLGSLTKEVVVVNNTISISELPTGVYFLTTTIDARTVSRKIVKK